LDRSQTEGLFVAARLSFGLPDPFANAKFKPLLIGLKGFRPEGPLATAKVCG
jgi:hypothetical protein